MKFFVLVACRARREKSFPVVADELLDLAVVWNIRVEVELAHQRPLARAHRVCSADGWHRILKQALGHWDLGACSPQNSCQNISHSNFCALAFSEGSTGSGQKLRDSQVVVCRTLENVISPSFTRGSATGSQNSRLSYTP